MKTAEVTTSDLPATLEQLEREHIQGVLRLTRGNKQRAADLLGISRKTLYRKLERWATEALGS